MGRYGRAPVHVRSESQGPRKQVKGEKKTKDKVSRGGQPARVCRIGLPFPVTIAFAIVTVGEWEIYQTNEVADWMENLRHADPEAADRVEAAVDVLSE